MKYFKVLAIGTATLIGTAAFAQKPKYRAFGVFEYFQPKMDEDFDKVTNVDINVRATSDQQFKWNAFTQELQFNNLNPDKSTPDIVKLEIIETHTNESKSQLKTRRTDDDITYYRYENRFDLDYDVMLYRNDALLWKEHLRLNGDVVGREKRSRKSAVVSHNKAILSAKGDEISKAAKELKVDIDELFVDVYKSVDVFMYTVKGKKHNYDDYNKMAESVGAMNTSKDYDKLKELVPYFENVLKDSDIENKKARINLEVTAATRFNLGVTHFMLGNYNEAISNFNVAKELKGLRFTNLYYLTEISEGLLLREELRK